MKFALIFLVVIAVNYSSALHTEHANLLKHEEVHDDNTYNVEYHLDDGTLVRERGVRVSGGEEGDVWHKSGSYRYVSPEGIPIEVSYTADHNGFNAQGNHLPREPLPLH